MQNEISTSAVLDEEGKPLVCECGQPVGDYYPHPVGLNPPGCYFCATNYFKSKGYLMPAERKAGEIKPGEDSVEWTHCEGAK